MGGCGESVPLFAPPGGWGALPGGLAAPDPAESVPVEGGAGCAGVLLGGAVCAGFGVGVIAAGSLLVTGLEA